MATVNPSIELVGNDAVRFTWVLNNTDFDGAPIGPNHADFRDRSVQAFGTFGGAAVAWQGTNEAEPASNWAQATNRAGAALSLSAAGQMGVGEPHRMQRPLLTGGAASSVTVIAYCRRERSRP